MSDKGILVAVGDDSPEDWLPVFAERYPGETVHWYRPDLPDSVLRACSHAIVWAPDAALLDRVGHMSALFSLGAGVDHITRSGVALPPIPIVRYVGDDLTHRMSEWIVLQCLAHLRQHGRYAMQQRDHTWRALSQPGAEDVRVGLMGLGVLGQDAAAKLKPFGFRLSGWSRTRKAIDGMTCFAGEGELDGFLAQTDFLVSLLPRTAETEGLVNRAFLEKLARDGVFGAPVYINAGRGKTQVDADVVAALQDGTLAGASLDVFETEPLPADHPAWDAPNLVITPHAAAWSKRSSVVDYVMGQIRRQREGLPLENVIDPQAGY
ncbi:glyoxylate/hydroxypyruvate reductase A [Zhengella mangrovi]|uniref:Glyoxylate/hydroxypyruvate reductase A n=1 Tax=Zhengella mangrovi TaxID=1982044 RepID=A0A2G1QUC6_9HYPH|nr:glyoxylate/hydroxypyruvate reductase A [Zhengella mangrovi]PHP69085.1 glyoxylate/hydroxypyruvate reductase A [Zhengella mangrovi]